MIDKFKVLDIVKDALEGTEKYLINMRITPDNRIYVDIDGDNGITIDDCIELSRTIENSLNREEEDFELNVSSAGADAPLKMPRQYRRHIGREVSVETFDNGTVEGTLTSADDNQFVIHIKGTKQVAPKDLTFAYTDIKSAKVVLKF
jgi:ribosome maturation factor RimP